MVGRPGAVSPVLAQDSQLPGTGGLARLSPFPQALLGSFWPKQRLIFQPGMPVSDFFLPSKLLFILENLPE